jgi:hypothetical protein
MHILLVSFGVCGIQKVDLTRAKLAHFVSYRAPFWAFVIKIMQPRRGRASFMCLKETFLAVRKKAKFEYERHGGRLRPLQSDLQLSCASGNETSAREH